MTQLTQSRSKKSLINIAVSIILLVIGFIVTFIYRKIFVTFFDVQYLGVTSLFSSIITVLSLAELGFGSAVMYALYKPISLNDKQSVAQIITYFRRIYYVIAMIVLAAGLIAMPLLPYFIKDMPSLQPNIYIIFAFYLGGTVLSYFNSYKTTLLLADQKEYLFKTIASVSKITSQFLIIGLLYVIKSFYIVLILENVIVIVQNIILSIIVNKKYTYLKEYKDKISKDLRKAINKYTASMFTHKLGGVILGVTDVLLISIFFGAAASGYYSNYLLLTTSINGIVGIIFSGIQASLGQYIVLNDNKKSQDMFKVINLICSWIAIFVTFGIFFVSDSFIIIWLGKEFVIDKLTLLMLSLSFLVENLARSQGLFIGVTGVFNKTAYLSILYALLNLGFSILFIYLFGLPGVFLGTVIARVVVFPIEIHYLCKYGLKQNTSSYYWRLISQLSVGVIAGLILYGCSLVNIQNNVLNFVFRFAIAVVVPNVLFIAFYCKTKEFKTLLSLFHIDRLINKISNKHKYDEENIEEINIIDIDDSHNKDDNSEEISEDDKL